jgi:protein SCO1
MRKDPLRPSAPHFSWRRRSARLIASIWVAGAAVSACIIASAATPDVAADPAAISQAPIAIEDFELIDQDGKAFRFSQLTGRPVLVFFGYTHCPDVCPTTLTKFRLLADSEEGKTERTAFVMISIDGERDSPAVMKDYLAQISPRCMGLTGDPRAGRRIAAQFSAVFFKGLSDKPGGPYLVEHTSQVYLVDRRGRLRAGFSDASVDTLRRAIAAVEDETREKGLPRP